MSYVNKGLTAATVIVGPTGNFQTDGTADEIQFRNARDYLTILGGGIIHVQMASYSFDSVETNGIVEFLGGSNNDNILVEGEGIGNTIINVANTVLTAGTHYGVFYMSDIENVSFRDLEVNGNVDNNAGIEWSVFQYSGSSWCQVEHCEGYEYRCQGVHWSGDSTYGIFNDNIFHDAARYNGISCYQSSYAVIRDNHIYNQYELGINCYSNTHDVVISGNKVGDTTAAVQYCGISMEQGTLTGTWGNFIVTDNKVYGDTRKGIEVLSTISGTPKSLLPVIIANNNLVPTNTQMYSGIFININTDSTLEQLIISENNITGYGTDGANQGAIKIVENGTIENGLIIGNTLQDQANGGLIRLEQVTGLSIIGNMLEGGAASGIEYYGNAAGHLIALNKFKTFPDGEHMIEGPSSSTIIGNSFLDATHTCHGISSPSSCFITGNMFNLTDGVASRAIYIWDQDNNIIFNNHFIESDVAVYIGNVGAEDNIVIWNWYATVNTELYDLGVNTILAAKVLPFINGTEWQAAAPWGWLVDLDTEYAATNGWMPGHVHRVMRIKVWAVAVPTEADAMRLELEGYGGTSNEPYNTTEPITVANKPSATTNFAANDFIYWVFDSGDDGDIDDVIHDDAVMIKVKHEAAGNGDCATNAVFLCAAVEYV